MTFCDKLVNLFATFDVAQVVQISQYRIYGGLIRVHCGPSLILNFIEKLSKNYSENQVLKSNGRRKTIRTQPEGLHDRFFLSLLVDSTSL